MVSIPSTKTTEQETASLLFAGHSKQRRTKKDFTMISNAILKDPLLSKGAKLALITLLSYCWFAKNNCFPGQERLSKDLDKSVRTIRRYLIELKEKKYIKIVRRGLGKTNIYHISLPANGTKLTGEERTTMTCPDRTKVTAKTDETKHTQVEATEALSNSSKGKVEAIQPQTDRHIANVTTRNTEENTEEKSEVSNQDTNSIHHTNPTPPNRAGTTKIEPPKPRETGRQRQGLKGNAEVMGKGTSTQRTIEPPRMTAPPFTQDDMDQRIRERLARERARQENPIADIIPPEHQQTLHRQFGGGAHTTSCKSKRQPVYEKLQLSVEKISEEMGDWHHVASNITQSENIRKQADIDIDQFLILLYEARTATKYALATDRITKRDAAGKLLKMPYFFAVLRDKAGLTKAQGTI